jgi:hypothetical protein
VELEEKVVQSVFIVLEYKECEGIYHSHSHLFLGNSTACSTKIEHLDSVLLVAVLNLSLHVCGIIPQK